MGMTPSQIGAILKKIGIDAEYNQEGQYFVFTIGTERFVDADGDKSLLMAIDIHEDGDFLQFVCPRLYNLRECPHKAAAFEAALVMAWRTKSVGYEYHPESGELRAVFELPLEDSMLTERQMARIVKTVYDLIETYDPVIRHAMKTGKVDMERTKHAEPDEEAVKNQEVSELIRQLGGLDKLREMASQNRAPGS